jgi:hypothetical protein
MCTDKNAVATLSRGAVADQYGQPLIQLEKFEYEAYDICRSCIS